MTYTFLPEPNTLLYVLSFVKGCVHLSFKFLLKMITYPKKILLASPKNIGMHTSTLEYVSTANISTTRTSP
jgi:hypothetical protein